MNTTQFVMPGFTDMWTLDTNKPQSCYTRETISDMIDYEMYIDDYSEDRDLVLAYMGSSLEDAWLRVCYPTE